MHVTRRARFVLVVTAVPAAAFAQGGSDSWSAAVLGTQIDVIGQRVNPFPAGYSGPMSLTSRGDNSVSHIYGVYLGARTIRHLDAYLDVEMARGNGISHASGLAAITNGDVLRQGTADLGNGPYVARAFARYTVPLGGAPDTLARAADQLPSIVAERRVEIAAGKFAVSDLLDLNRYANSARTQFMNWGLFQNTAWDFAADTRGYTNGIAVSWITPRWALRAGSWQMPTLANGNKFDPDLRRAHAENAELTLNVLPEDGVVRFLGFTNHARMGDYRNAIANAAPGAAPSIVADDRPGREKHGVGINAEQPLADSGETGVFARWGWNDGATESFVFTEAEGHLSAGLQIAGSHWNRGSDRFAIAALQHQIWAPHRDYLARGGIGFLLGDGTLRYGPEQLVETYYRMQAGPYVQVSPDLQYIRNPGYNRDRGPALVSSFRLNLRY